MDDPDGADDVWDWDDGDELEPLAVELRAVDEQPADASDEGSDEAAGGDWRLRAACRTEKGELLDLFFPWNLDEVPPAAAALCASCEVAGPCLEYGVRHEPNGVWGGASEQQRARMRRQLRIRMQPLEWALHGPDDGEEPEEADEDGWDE